MIKTNLIAIHDVPNKQKNLLNIMGFISTIKILFNYLEEREIKVFIKQYPFKKIYYEKF